MDWRWQGWFLSIPEKSARAEKKSILIIASEYWACIPYQTDCSPLPLRPAKADNLREREWGAECVRWSRYDHILIISTPLCWKDHITWLPVLAEEEAESEQFGTEYTRKETGPDRPHLLKKQPVLAPRPVLPLGYLCSWRKRKKGWVSAGSGGSERCGLHSLSWCSDGNLSDVNCYFQHVDRLHKIETDYRSEL